MHKSQVKGTKYKSSRQGEEKEAVESEARGARSEREEDHAIHMHDGGYYTAAVYTLLYTVYALYNSIIYTLCCLCCVYHIYSIEIRRREQQTAQERSTNTAAERA